MKLKISTYILLACYIATLLRLNINNNFVVSIIGSFIFGYVIPKRLNYSKKRIIISGFLSCFTSFSGFLYSLYIILNQRDFIKLIISFNFVILLNLFTMYFGFWMSRKIP